MELSFQGLDLVVTRVTLGPLTKKVKKENESIEKEGLFTLMRMNCLGVMVRNIWVLTT